MEKRLEEWKQGLEKSIQEYKEMIKIQEQFINESGLGKAFRVYAQNIGSKEETFLSVHQNDMENTQEEETVEQAGEINWWESDHSQGEDPQYHKQGLDSRKMKTR